MLLCLILLVGHALQSNPGSDFVSTQKIKASVFPFGYLHANR